MSCAQAALEMCPYEINESDVIEAFKELVGLSRKEVASTLLEQFDLTENSRKRMTEFDVQVPWQLYVQVRLNLYDEMLADSNVIRSNQWSHTMDLLRVLQKKTAKLGLRQCRTVPRLNGCW